jgi:zinc protease
VKISNGLSVLILAGASAAIAQQSPTLPIDPRLVQGELDNGLKYMVQRHANPPGRAVMWIHVSSGSLNEKDEQRGIAHYLEHMAFNGSKNFPPGEVVKFFQSLGMTFGRDQNAFTSFEQTVYQLSLPDVKTETIDKGLTFFSDVATGLLLLDSEIESERQIILEERTSRSSAQSRVMETMIKRMVPGSILGERLPIGTPETIGSVKKPDFEDYYNRYYVLSNMTLMVVADEEPAKVVERIEAVFGQDKTRKPTPEDVPTGVKPYAESFAIVVTDPELPRAQVSIAHLELPLPPSTTEADLRREFIDSLAGAAFNRRMENLKSRGEMVGQLVAAGTNQTAGAFREAQIMSMGKGDQWLPMVNQIATELVRARTYGFSDSEIEQARKAMIAGMEQQAQREDTAPAGRVISRLNNAVVAGEHPMSAKQMLEFGRAMLPGITATEVSSYFNAEFKTDAVRVAYAGGTEGAPTEEQLLAAAKSALSAKVDKRDEAAVAKTLLDKAPEAGKIVDSAIHEASGVTSAWLSNNVRVHHRFMNDEKNTVSVSVSLYGGELDETAETRGLTDAALTGWGRQRATSKLTSSDIRDLMTGKKVNVGGGGGGDGIAISINGSPEDLEDGFKLAYLMLTDPKIEPAALADWKTLQKQAIESREKEPGPMFATLLPEALYPEGDVRVRPLSIEQVERVTIEAAQARLKQLIASGPIEVAVVGDIDATRAMQLVTTYIGSIPTRERVNAEMFMPARTLARPEGAKTVRRDMRTATDQGSVFVGFYGPDSWQEADVRAMGLASRVISTRMIEEIREKAQLVYSIGSRSTPGDIFPGFGVFSASSTTQPEKADALVAKIREMFDAFAKDGPTDEELNVAKLQIAKSFETSVRQNGYWMGVLGDYTTSRVNLDHVLIADKLSGQVSKEQVVETFRKYYRKGDLKVVEVRPLREAK